VHAVTHHRGAAAKLHIAEDGAFAYSNITSSAEDDPLVLAGGDNGRAPDTPRRMTAASAVLHTSVEVRARARACVCARACVRACVCARVRVCVRACVCARARVCARVRVRARVVRVNA
jgi:hypothetical protein